jgi:hypothetical protein
VALGHPTRGKTAPNRLRRLDAWVSVMAPGVLRDGSGPFVDLGFGRLSHTTVDSARRFREVDPDLEVVGVEIDAERVAAARAHEDEQTRFVHGGFDYRGVAPARLIRAMNVLRQYGEDAVTEAHREIGARMDEGGLLLEGTSDPFGRVMVVHVLWRRGAHLVSDGLLFGTNFKLGVDAELFPPVLPKSHIHRMVEGEPIAAFMEAWRHAERHTRAVAVFGPNQHLAATAARLGQRFRIDRRPWLVRNGWVWWRRPALEPNPIED